MTQDVPEEWKRNLICFLQNGVKQELNKFVLILNPVSSKRNKSTSIIQQLMKAKGSKISLKLLYFKL